MLDPRHNIQPETLRYLRTRGVADKSLPSPVRTWNEKNHEKRARRRADLIGYWFMGICAAAYIVLVVVQS